MRGLKAILLAGVCLPGAAYAALPAPTFTNQAVPVTSFPCDALLSGCLTAYSVVQKMTANYSGPLFRVYRLDGKTFDISAKPSTGIVDVPALHAACDGYDCFVGILYDQGTAGNTLTNSGPGTATNTLTNGTTGNAPILYWDRNGLPEMAFNVGNNIFSNKHGWYTNQHMWLYPAQGLPTTGSRTLYVAADNYNWTQGVEFFGYGGSTAQPGGEATADGWTVVISQQDPNTPGTAVFGVDLETSWNWGVYPGGYGKVTGLIKYNQPTNISSGAVLPQVSCTTSDVKSCTQYTVYAAGPGYGSITTGPLGNTMRLGTGTDDGGTGGRFQSGAVAAYATTPVEDAAFLKAMANVTFAPPVSPCSPSASTLTSGKPTTTGVATTPTSYPTIPALNEANLVALYSTVLWNPNYMGPILRVQRQDNNVSYDIYSAACQIDIQTVTNDCAGTTCWVTRWYDQSGHGWTAINPVASTLLAPTLNLTGMNSKPCVSFTYASATSFTGQKGATATAVGNGDGTVTISAVTGTISVNDQIYVPTTVYTELAVITGQRSGTPGGAGVYTVEKRGTNQYNPGPAYPTFGSQSVTIESQYLIVTAWTSGSITTGQALGASNQAVEVITGQVSGTPGQVGVYVTDVYGQLASAVRGTYTQNILAVDRSLWYQPMAGPGFFQYQNQTLEAVFQSTSTTIDPLISAAPGWSLGYQASKIPTYGYGAAITSALNFGSSFASGTPHFLTLTADKSAPQNLSINLDAGTPATGTTTQYAGLASSTAPTLALGSNTLGRAFTGCMTLAAVYNDVESAPNLAAAHARAVAEWATP